MAAPATKSKLGEYELARDPRGIRLTRPPAPNLPPVSPLLSLSITEPGKQPQLFVIDRLAPSPDGGMDIHGSQTDRITIDGNVIYRPDLDGLEFTLRIVNATADMDVRFGTVFELTGEGDPRWMVPGLFYRDNRPAPCTHVFPTFHEFTRDPRQFISSHWSFRADRAAMPVAFVWTYGCFAFYSTSETFGVTPEHPEGAGMASLRFALEDGNPHIGGEFPYREGPVKYSFCHEDRNDADETFLNLPKRVPLVVNFVVGFSKPDLHAYDRVIRALYARHARFHPVRARGSSEEAERSAHMGLLRWHYDPQTACIYETATFEKQFGQRGTHFERTMMHVGGPSGALPAYVLLWGGREAEHAVSIEAAVSTIDKITSGISPAGTLFPIWTEEFGWSCSYGPDEGTAHSRTIAEAVFFILRAMRLELKHNQARTNWFEAVSSSLNYAMAAQRSDGAFPTYFDLTTGRPTSFDGFGGAAWIAALVAGSSLLYRSHYREVLAAAGEYYMNMVKEEFLFGSIEDQPYVPSCDDAHWAIISFLMLYEFDRDARWLATAKRAADLAMTWRFGYNSTFSKHTMCGTMGLRTRGGDVLSVATPVLTANGLICYGELLKLSALTGDKYYKDRAEDSRLFASQLVAREEGDLNARIGMTVAQLCHTDWVEPKGRIPILSGASSCALIRYAELTRRSLNIPLQLLEGQEESELEMEMSGAPVLYSDVTLSRDRPQSSPEVPRLPSLSLIPRPEPVSSRQSSSAVKPPSFAPPGSFSGIPEPTPPPYAVVREAPAPPSEAPEEPDPDIKYKIF